MKTPQGHASKEEIALLGSRFFLLFYLVIFASFIAVSLFGIGILVDVPRTGLWAEGDMTTTLIVLASVSVVVWTGGFIVLQRRNIDLRNLLGMDLVAICFVGATLTLIAHASPLLGGKSLRPIAIFFAIRYARQYVYGLLGNLEAGYRIGINFNLNGLRYMIPVYLAAIVVPTENAVAWLGAGTLYCGMLQILSAANTAAPADVTSAGSEEAKPTSLPA
jgi:hypothetical protein